MNTAAIGARAAALAAAGLPPAPPRRRQPSAPLRSRARCKPTPRNNSGWSMQQRRPCCRRSFAAANRADGGSAGNEECGCAAGCRAYCRVGGGCDGQGNAVGIPAARGPALLRHGVSRSSGGRAAPVALRVTPAPECQRHGSRRGNGPRSVRTLSGFGDACCRMYGCAAVTGGA